MNKQTTNLAERVFIKKAGPTEPNANSTGGELLHGYLCDIYRLANGELTGTVESLRYKWNILYGDHPSGAAIDYQKTFVERVFIKKDGPTEPDVNATGGELLHGYLCDIYRLRQKDENLKQTIDLLCRKWNVFYT